TITSGSTTDKDSQKDFAEKLAKSDPGAEFHSTVHSSYVAVCSFLRRVQKAEPDDDVRVALLSEGDTAFGEGIRKTRPDQPDQLASQADSNCLDKDHRINVRLMNLPFPRDIARLRNAYHEDFLTTPIPDAYKTAQREGVPLTLK